MHLARHGGAMARRRSVVPMLAAAWALGSAATFADPTVDVRLPPPLVGPAFGTTYRVQLGHMPGGHAPGRVHRAIEEVLAAIDAWASTWRDDSDASRFNDAPADVWVPVSGELVALVEEARCIHAASAGAFDVTIAPLVAAWGGGPPRLRAVAGGPPTTPPTEAVIAMALGRVGMHHVESRAADHADGPALRKRMPGIMLDLSGIAPGHAVDRIGQRLVALGSTDHLVELGGEVRAWGRRPDGTPWQVAIRHPLPGGVARQIMLADGEALAASTARPGISPLDPCSGRPPAHRLVQAIVRAGSCASADAWAVACLVRGSPPPHTGRSSAVVDEAPAPLAVEFVPAPVVGP